MSSHARYGTGGTSRKKVCVTYTVRDEKEPLNRSGVNRLRVDNCSSLSRDLVLTAGRDSIIRAWDLKELNETNGRAECCLTLEHHTGWVNDIVLCKGGSILMSASSDTSLKVWDLTRGSCTSTLKPHSDYIQALAYSPLTETVVSAGLDHELYLWDVNALTSLTASKNTVTTIPLNGQKKSIYSVDINKQGTLVVSGSTEKALKVWDTRSYQKLMKLKGHTDNVRTVIINEDGTECLSGSSDGTVRLWSIGQQRCVETFRLHSGGVWALEVDDSFKYFYSGGKDRNVYLTDMSDSNRDSVLLFTEERSVLSLALDKTDNVESLWVSTTGTSVRKWPAVPLELDDNTNTEGRGDGVEEEGGDPAVTDIDELTRPPHSEPLLSIPGGSTIVECKILSNKRQVLTKDNSGNVALWDVLHGVLVEELGSVDIDEVSKDERFKSLFVPNWFSCDIKTGMLSIRLEENDCFSAWVMGNDTNLPNTSDLKLNYGALMLKALFEHWPESYAIKQEERAMEEKLEEMRATIVTRKMFLSAVESVTDSTELGRQLGLTESALNSLHNEGTQKSNVYGQMYECFQDDSLTLDHLCKALLNMEYTDLVAELEKSLITCNGDGGAGGGTSSKVDNKFFSVPLHTPVVLSESTDCGATLVRFTCGNVANPHERNLLKTFCPLWISDIVAQNQLPPHPKMSFTLAKESNFKDSKADRLSAQDILTVKKVAEYLQSKMYKDQETSDTIEIYCQGQLLVPSLDMRTVRHTVWKSGGDMKLFYKIIEAGPVVVENGEVNEEESKETSNGDDGGEANGDKEKENGEGQEMEESVPPDDD